MMVWVPHRAGRHNYDRDRLRKLPEPYPNEQLTRREGSACNRCLFIAYPSPMPDNFCHPTLTICVSDCIRRHPPTLLILHRFENQWLFCLHVLPQACNFGMGSAIDRASSILAIEQENFVTLGEYRDEEE
jgi:hypothetical protein